MRPTTSCLMGAAVIAACSWLSAAEVSAAGYGGNAGARPGPASSAPRSGRVFVAGGGRRAFGCVGCGYGVPYLGYGYGYGYGDFGYGYRFIGNDPFDPRRIRGDLPDDRNSAVPAVAGIPAPPVLPPAIYVIGDGEARGGRRVRSSSRAGAQPSAGPRVVRVR